MRINAVCQRWRIAERFGGRDIDQIHLGLEMIQHTLGPSDWVRRACSGCGSRFPILSRSNDLQLALHNSERSFKELQRAAKRYTTNEQLCDRRIAWECRERISKANQTTHWPLHEHPPGQPIRKPQTSKLIKIIQVHSGPAYLQVESFNRRNSVCFICFRL